MTTTCTACYGKSPYGGALLPFPCPKCGGEFQRPAVARPATESTLDAVRAWHKPAVPITRAEIEALKGWERPRVRCRVDGSSLTVSGGISIDGNNPWVEFSRLEVQYAAKFSWGLLLEVLNDPHAAPLGFSDHDKNG